MIMLREKPVWQESELKMQRQRLIRSRKKWQMLKTQDWQQESPKKCFCSWWLLLETVWAILQVPTLRMMGKMRIMKLQRWVSCAKMTNLAGWWAQYWICYSSTWRDFGRSRWSLMSWHSQDGGDAADYIHDRHREYRTTELNIQAGVSPQRDEVAAASALRTFGELLQSLDTVLGKLEMLQGTSQPGHTHMRLSSGKAHTDTHMWSRLPDTKLDSSPSNNTNSVEL